MTQRLAHCIVLFVALSISLALAQDPPAVNHGWGDKNAEVVYAPLQKVPSKAASRTNPMERDPEAVVAGAKLYDLHCAECHGEMAEGARKGPSLRAQSVQQATPGTLFWLLTNGVVRRGMPVWSKLPEPQRWQLVSYVKSLTFPGKTPEMKDSTSEVPHQAENVNRP